RQRAHIVFAKRRKQAAEAILTHALELAGMKSRWINEALRIRRAEQANRFRAAVRAAAGTATGHGGQQKKGGEPSPWQEAGIYEASERGKCVLCGGPYEGGDEIAWPLQGAGESIAGHRSCAESSGLLDHLFE